MTAAPRTDSAPFMLSVSGARGIVGKTMTPDVATAYAAAFGSYLKGVCGTPSPHVVLALDGRASGHELADAAAKGLVATGCQVSDIGVAMTPTVGVMIAELQAHGGLTITASHNPIQWNGIKCLDSNGVAPPPETAREIVERFRAQRVDPAAPGHAGAVRTVSGAARTHVQRVLKQVDVAAIRAQRFAVVLDSVNASGCEGGRLLLEELGCTVTHIFGECTGVFGHTPEPLAENLRELAARVRATPGAVAGFAQDPDADRLAIIDERGTYIGEEYTLVLAAVRALQRAGSGVLAANLSTSRMIDDVAARFSGTTVLRTAVGEANVVSALRAHHGILGGEGNGGVIFPAVCWVRDSLSAMALTLELLAHEGAPLSTVVATLPRYAIVKRKLDLAAVGGHSAVAPALERVRGAFKDARVDATDGVRLDFARGWVHLRASNTEPLVRIIAEASTADDAMRLAQECAVAAGLPG